VIKQQMTKRWRSYFCTEWGLAFLKEVLKKMAF